MRKANCEHVCVCVCACVWVCVCARVFCVYTCGKVMSGDGNKRLLCAKHCNPPYRLQLFSSCFGDSVSTPGVRDVGEEGSEAFGTDPVSLPLLLPSLPVWHHLGAEGSLDGLIQAVWSVWNRPQVVLFSRPHMQLSLQVISCRPWVGASVLRTCCGGVQGWHWFSVYSFGIDTA